MMAIRSFASVCVLALALGLVPTLARADALLDGIATLPGAVEDVRIAGNWMRDGDAGAYRVLIARTGMANLSARMFVQWIVYDDGGEASVRATIEIVELAALHTDVADYTAESDEEGLSVFIDTMSPGGLPGTLYELYVTAPDKYRFGPASN